MSTPEKNKELHKMFSNEILKKIEKENNKNIKAEDLFVLMEYLDPKKENLKQAYDFTKMAQYSLILYSEIENKEPKDVIDFANDLYYKKNKNYGNSFSQCFKKYGVISAIVQLFHKVNRIETLIKDKENHYESISDNYLDIYNYSIMTLMELIKEDIKINLTGE